MGVGEAWYLVKLAWGQDTGMNESSDLCLIDMEQVAVVNDAEK